mgnify:CR=1 FL=1
MSGYLTNGNSEENMRIGYDAKRYYHNHTGLGNYSRTLVRDMQRLHPEVEIRLYDEKGLTRLRRLGRKAAAEGCQIYHGLSNELPFDLSQGVRNREMLPRAVVTMHDTAWRTYPEMYHMADRVIYDYKYGHAARHADCVVAISESTKRDVMRFYGVAEDRIRVIYQPVQRMFYEEREKREQEHGEQAPYLLSVGSINARKNLLGTLQAYSLLQKENRPRLIIVGKGREYERKCRDFVLKNGLEKEVIFKGSVNSTEELHSLYREAVAMLYPSHYEGFGLPVVEALLSGCPVLTSSVSSLPEAAGPGALYCDPADTDEIAHQLKRLVDDMSLREKLAREGKAYCLEHFEPDSLTEQMFGLYKSLL